MTASQPMRGLKRPRVKGPGTKLLLLKVCRQAMGMPYDAIRPMLVMLTTAENAAADFRSGKPSTKAPAVNSQIARRGVQVHSLTWLKNLWQGMAPLRENEYSILRTCTACQTPW